MGERPALGPPLRFLAMSQISSPLVLRLVESMTVVWVEALSEPVGTADGGSVKHLEEGAQ